MPFTRINFRDTSVEVEHEIDATEEEIIQLAREKLAAAKKQQAELAAAEEAARLANQEAVPLKSQQEQLAAEQLAVEQRGSLGRTGVGLAAEVAVAEGGKLAGTRAGALIGGRLGAVGGLAGVSEYAENGTALTRQLDAFTAEGGTVTPNSERVLIWRPKLLDSLQQVGQLLLEQR